MTLRISNPDARRLWLASLGLDGERLDPLATIRRLGFVQLDTIPEWSPAPTSTSCGAATRPIASPCSTSSCTRALFEHYAHDASLVPMEVYPY